MSSTNIDWNDVIKKEARGINDADFGEVQEVSTGFVITQRGLIDVEVFGIPKERAESYDGSVLRFNVTEDELSVNIEKAEKIPLKHFHKKRFQL